MLNSRSVLRPLFRSTVVRFMAVSVLVGGACIAAAQTKPEKPKEADAPVHIPASGGEVILANSGERYGYDHYHYAAARRVGDTLYISGVVVGRREGEGKDTEAFKEQCRRAFRRIEATLAAAGATFDDVVMINSFHVWQGPNFDGDKAAQFAAVGAVKDEFMNPPYPAWTAVGTTALIPDNGIVEIQMIAHLKKK